MNGAGFIKDMIAVTRNNRALLKGKSQASYQNFDKSYITDWIISRKIPKYKIATPEYLAELRNKLAQERRQQRGRRILAATITIALLTMGIVTFSYLNVI